MQRVFFFLIIIFTLASCSIPWITKEIHTFEGDYTRIVDKVVPSKWFWYSDGIESLKSIMIPSGSNNSWIRFAFWLPELASGDMTLVANTKREWMQKFSADMSLTWNISWPNGTIEAKNISWKLFMAPQKARYYAFLEQFNIWGTVITQKMQEDIVKLKESMGKWWVYDPMDIVFKYAKSDTSMDDGASIVQIYIGLLQDIQTPGWFARLNSIISKNPIFE